MKQDKVIVYIARAINFLERLKYKVQEERFHEATEKAKLNTSKIPILCKTKILDSTGHYVTTLTSFVDNSSKDAEQGFMYDRTR